MMDFFMLCCKKILNFRTGIVVLSMCICTSVANAEGITIIKAESRQVEDGYEIVADFKITLPPTVAEALIRGVALNFVSEQTVTRSRWYWFDSAIIQNEQQTKLSYNALTKQYRISRGILFQSFTNLESALQVLGHQTSQPVPVSILSGGGGYVARILKSETVFTAFAQMRLDTSLLPKPLQVSALTNSEWSLESEKYSWKIIPGTLETEGIPTQ
jgi:hypothetical protein